MNLLRKIEELRTYMKDSLANAQRIGGETLTIVEQHVYNISVLLGKVEIWRDNGAKTFRLSKELMEAFQHTDVPLNLFPIDFQYPFDTFLVESETPMFFTKTFVGDRLGARPIFSMLYLSSEVVYRDSTKVFIKSDGTVVDKLEWDKSLTAFYPGDELGVENMMIHMKDNCSIIDTVKCAKMGFGIVPLDRDDAQNMVNIFYNTVMYINDPSRSRVETEVVQTRKVNDGQKKVSAGYIYLKPPKSYVSLSKSGRVLDKRFVVRGHWKMQAYGEKYSLRKNMWIKPYWKGPELAEIVNKPYNVK